MSTVTILYLVGSGRSGTTLLSRLIELQGGFRAVGETRYLGDPERWPMECGCGSPHQACDLWGPQVDRLRANPDLRRSWLSAVYARQLDQLAGFASPRWPSRRVQEGLQQVRHVYETLGGAGDVVVDESKTPWLGFMLGTQPWASVRFVELVRDPREVIKSWQQTKDYLERTPREAAAKHWLRTCLTAEAIRKRTGLPWFRTSYQRLANRPEDVVSAITCRSVQGLGRLEGMTRFDAPANHIFLSNPDKLRRGSDVVRPARAVSPTSHPGAGPWERAAVAYWQAWLSRRSELTFAWTQ